MALFQRTRILANQRLDLPDFNNIEDFICADFKAIHKNVWTNQNFVFSGFAASGIGTNTVSIALAGSSLVIGQNDGVLYIGASSLSPASTSSLTPGSTNYIELSISQDTGGADSRAFWDGTAAGGEGAEFSQIVDTFIFLKADLNVSTSNFSGDPDKVKICEVDVNGSGVITAIRDARNLFWRLGRSNNPAYSYPWASRVEPASTAFNGADKDITNLKQWADSVMDAVREMKGTTYWYELAPVTITGGFRNTGLSILVGATSSAKLSWSGTQLAITDDNGSPVDADILAYVRLFDSTVNLRLSRQDGINAISLADGEVLWVEIPNPLATTTYDSVGSTATNYRVTSRGSVPNDQDVYWLAYREGTRVYLRGLGELEPGEAKQINDETTESLATFLGFDPETATFVPYTETPRSQLPAQFTTSDTLVKAISDITENVNYLDEIINDSNGYEESYDIVASSPVGNELLGPITTGTLIPLPLDSRASNSTEYYIVGKGTLEVFLNGQHLTPGVDWLESGTSGSPSTFIQINRDLVVGDKISFRNVVFGGIVFVGGGGGGSGSLQDAYGNGNTITTSTGVPLYVNGPSGQKIAIFNGDITVTGVIDPKGITFIPQAATPISGHNGLWVDTAGNLIHSRPSYPDVNITTALDGSSPAGSTQIQVYNQSGQQLTQFAPVCIDSLGYLAPIDVANEAKSLAIIGLMTAAANNNTLGSVIQSGKIENITTSANYGDVLYVSKTGGITSTKPSIGTGGFVAGDFVLRLGVISRNIDSPSQKDLLVNISIVGEL